MGKSLTECERFNCEMNFSIRKSGTFASRCPSNNYIREKKKQCYQYARRLPKVFGRFEKYVLQNNEQRTFLMINVNFVFFFTMNENLTMSVFGVQFSVDKL